MKFLLCKTSDIKYIEVVDIHSLEQLLEFQESVKHPIIISKNILYKGSRKTWPGVTKKNEQKGVFEAEWRIEIYDYYGE